MTRWVAILTLGALLAVAMPPPAPVQGATGKIGWYSHDEGIRAAQASGKKVYIFFSTENCVWCRRMEASTFRDKAVTAQLNQYFIPIHVDREKEPAVARQYYPGSEVPYSWFVAEDGGEIARLLGYISPDKMIWILKYISTDSYKEITFEHFMRSAK